MNRAYPGAPLRGGGYQPIGLLEKLFRLWVGPIYGLFSSSARVQSPWGVDFEQIGETSRTDTWLRGSPARHHLYLRKRVGGSRRGRTRRWGILEIRPRHTSSSPSASPSPPSPPSLRRRRANGRRSTSWWRRGWSPTWSTCSSPRPSSRSSTAQSGSSTASSSRPLPPPRPPKSGSTPGIDTTLTSTPWWVVNSGISKFFFWK